MTGEGPKGRLVPAAAASAARVRIQRPAGTKDILPDEAGAWRRLESFARSPSTALCGVEVETYVLVTHFQHVVEMKVSEWSSSNL